MTEYFTIIADYGDMNFEQKLSKYLSEGWAVYNIWAHPQKPYLPLVKGIIITLIRTKS